MALQEIPGAVRRQAQTCRTLWKKLKDNNGAHESDDNVGQFIENNFYRMMTENPNHAATTQMTPFDLLGEARGFNTIVRARDVLGPYLGLVAGVRKSWAEANRDLVVRFIRAYARGVEAM